jgi:hypothetical protein
MTKQLLLINQEKIEEAYNQEYLNELISYYNNILGYQGVTKAEIVICNRNDVNRKSDLQPKLYSISPDDVDRIIQLYKSYDLDLSCELQLITNKSLWDESEKINEDELLAGFKRDRAQNKLKSEKLAFQSSELMAYIRLHFSDKKAFRYVKTISNTQKPNENKQPNSPDDIVVCIEDCIEDGSLGIDLYQLDNEEQLIKEIETLTKDKSGKFRTEVKNKFYAKSNKDKRYEIIYSGNVNDIAEDRELPKSGEYFKERDSNLYHSSSGEMKTTWFNMFKKYCNENKFVDFVLYVGKPSDLPVQRLEEIKKLLESYSIFNKLDPSVNINKIIRCVGWHTQAKKGLPYLKGKKETSVAENNIIRHPFDWFYVTSEKEMKNFLRDNLTDIEKKHADQFFNDALVEKQYKDIMELYKNSCMPK